MVRFNELRITEDRSCLIVDCEIEQIGLYSDVYIKTIYLDYYEYVDGSGFPTTKSFVLYDNEDDDTRVKGQRIAMVDTALSRTEFGINSFKDGLFYVTVECAGTLPASVSSLPCGADSMLDTQVVIDWKGFYERGMQYISSMVSGCADKCSMPVGFEEFILLWNALETAIAVCDWPLVAKLWKRILRYSFAGGSTAGISGGCGCGR